MITLDQIRLKVGQFLGGSLALDDFEDWFLGNAWNAHLSADVGTVSVVHCIEGSLLDFAADAINEARLREELARIAIPFASAVVVQSFGSRGPIEPILIDGVPQVIEMPLGAAIPKRPMARALGGFHELQVAYE
jgi:hypothetical protein